MTIRGERIEAERLAELAGAEHEMAVSLYLPTIKAGQETRQNPIRFKNALRELEGRLGEDGREALGERWTALERLVDDFEFWQHTDLGTVFLATPQEQHVFALALEPGERVAVGNRFVVSPLIAALDWSRRFRLLALSQNRVRLYEGDGYGLSRVEPGDHIPRSLADALGYDVTGPALQYHSQGAGDGPIYHGQGAGEDERKQETRKFLRRLADALGETIRDDTLPLVLAGVEYEAAMYRDVAGHADRIIGTVDGNVEDWSDERLHEAAWEVCERSLEAERRRQIERLEEAGSDSLALEAGSAVAAAANGRVELLFYDPERPLRGTLAADRQSVELAGEDDENAEDLIELAARETFLQGGAVYRASRHALPALKDSPAVALLRY